MIELLKKAANNAGIAAVGVAPAIDEVVEQYPWARSVICAAISYLPPEHTDEGEEPRGLVARFARSLDYHVVLREKLEVVAGAIARYRPDARFEVCVDTCPLPERKLAVLSGIAWPSKNGNVFVDGLGSWVALGEIVTDLSLTGDAERKQSRCRSCNICIQACPAGAIVEPGVIDRSRCISALTQASGSIDLELRELMGINIYGCDICQQVCPHNKGIQPVTPEFANVVFPGKSPALLPLIRLSAADYKAQVAASSIGWLRRTRIRRNAAIAAGNLQCGVAIDALEEMCNDESLTLREVARWAINKIGKH
ncbi:MAG: tRNA epoxyqueuosine(34) reductase QueG [Armatimonadota bacterium]|jgi:epoxyqueuosine reductase